MRHSRIIAPPLALVALVALVALAACGQANRKAPPALATAVDLPLVVGPELGTLASVDDASSQVAAAFGNGSYLVVWTQLGAAGDDIVGARVSATGQVIDTAPFVVSSQPGDEASPAVAFDGTNFLVVWQDHRSGPFMNIYGARVSADGAVLDPAGFPVDVQVDHQTNPAVAFDGTNYVVVWADHRAGTNWDVYGTRVTTAGVVLDPDGFAVTTAPSHQTAPAIAAGPSGSLVVWQDQRGGDTNVYGARVSTAGVVLDPTGLAISTAANLQTVPAVASDGAGFVVAWQDQRGVVDADVYAARVAADGTVRDPGGIAVATGPSDQRLPAIAYDGRDILVAWENGPAGASDVQAARLGADGAVLDVPAVAIAKGIVGVSHALSSDAAGRVLAVYDPLGTTGAVLQSRLLTDWATLDVARAGRGNGTVTSTPSGIACGATCSARFDGGTSVTLVAAADADSAFTGWSGACSGTGPCTVTVDEARAVTATFVPLYPVTVARGTTTPGTVTSTPAGIACGDGCNARFPEGTTVSLAAAGAPGASVFGSWAGACAGTGACTFVVDGPKAVTATFLPAVSVTLYTTGSGTGALTLGATTCPSGAACAVDVATSSTAMVTATLDAEAVLKSWSGCTSSSGTTCTVSISTYGRTISAKLDPRTFPLSAAFTGTGAGTISGGGLSCTSGSSAGCTAQVENLAFTTAYPTVSLRATPADGSVFKSWSGCIAVTGDPTACTLSVNSAKYLSAKLEPSTIPLQVSLTGTGAGSVTGGGVACTTGSSAGCTAAVENPANQSSYTTVTLRATPAAGSVLKSWSGCTVVAGDPTACTILVSSSKFVAVKFEPSTYPLQAGFSGAGTGAVTGAGLACATGVADGCTAPVDNPPYTTSYSSVTLRATADAGSVFKGWSGCTAVAGDFAACTLTVSSAKYVFAKFEPSTVPLTAAPTGTGTGTVTGAGLACTSGSPDGCMAAVPNPADSAAYTTVTLRAAPADGSVFKSWSGCTAVAGDPRSCTLLVNMSKYVQAKFEPATFAVTVGPSSSGGGTVSGAGLACTLGLGTSSDGCTTSVANPPDSAAYGTITLSAAADGSSLFKGWSGCTASATDPASCSLSVNGPKYLSVKFDPSTYALSVFLPGIGSGSVSGGGIACRTGSQDGCSAIEPNGANVTLSATPDTGSILKSWSGCTPAADGTCSVAMSAAHTVSVSFQPATYPLSISFTGTGSGIVDASGATCASDSSGCTFDEANGASVRLTAAANAGSTFTGWSGICTGTGECLVSMTMSRYVRASFSSP